MVTDLFGNPSFSDRRLMWFLTWHQPFASLMLHGKKETRTNYTKVRGDVLILASKNPYQNFQLFDMCGPELLASINETLKDEPTREITGMAIAVGNLFACRAMTPEDEKDCFIKYKEPWLDLKAKTLIRKRLWIWEFRNVKAIEPFDFSGHQGWGNLTDSKGGQEIINKIKYI